MKLPFVKNIFICMSVFTIFILASSFITINLVLYLNKYKDSSSLYEMLSDLSYNIPGPYALRETFFNWIIFPFYGESDKKI